VETHGELKDGESFNDITDYQKIVASDVNLLTQNLAKQLLTYATGRPIRFSERAELEKIVTQTIASGAGVRTLIEEIIQSPLFFQPKQDQKSFETKKTAHPIVAGEAPPPRDSDTTSEDVSNRVPDAKNRFMMTETLESIEHPVRIETITTTDPSDLQRQREMTFKDEDQMTVRVLGLFIKEQSDSFNKALQRIDELRLVAINFEKAEATIQYADSLASGTTSEITERLNQRVRQHTSGIFSLKTLGKIPHDQFEKVEIEIVGLDCKACSLAVHDLIVSIDGVTHATADFESGQAYAWFDASKCSAATIKDRLTESGVTLRSEDRGETNPSE
jgi:copper chaperone CopZ